MRRCMNRYWPYSVHQTVAPTDRQSNVAPRTVEYDVPALREILQRTGMLDGGPKLLYLAMTRQLTR